MKKVVVFYMTLAVCALVMQVSARPATASFQTVSNKDGSSVSIRYFGDEHYHYVETSDGYLVMLDSDGNFVYVGEDGRASKVVAKNVADRTEDEKAFLNGLDQEAVRENHEKLHGGRFPEDSSIKADSQAQNVSASQTAVMAYNQDGVSVALNRPTPSRWTVGERWFPVLLIGTSDKPYGDSAAFYDFLNKPGYNVNNNIGSLRDYFLYVSDSLFDPHFDVYPIQLNRTLLSFGSGDDFKEGEFVSVGIDEMVKRSDFLANAKKYCSKNSEVDGFFYLFPGKEEDALKQSENFWGHQFWMESNGSSTSWWFPTAYKAAGYTFNAYVFIAQYADRSSKNKINKMGIFAHEFSHVMGISDHYAKDENKNQIDGPGVYDIMSLGMYNGSTLEEGNAPMGYSAFEKETVGWLTLRDLQPDSVYTLKKLSQMQAYSVTNPNQTDEYYIVEYRPAERYDAYVPRRLDSDLAQNGVYVWYIDYNQKIFVQQNKANLDVNHQRVAINAVLTKNAYYVDFTYVNKGGTSPIPGVYNVVLDGDRACFTTSKDISLKECPAESSSSVESSSSEASSSSAISSSSVASSSSQAEATSSSSESSDLSSSSSEEVIRVVAGVAMPQSQMILEGRVFHVSTDVVGVKSVRVFDMQGHLVQAKKFLGSAVTLDFGNMKCGAYMVRLMAENKTIAVKTLALKNN